MHCVLDQRQQLWATVLQQDPEHCGGPGVTPQVAQTQGDGIHQVVSIGTQQLFYTPTTEQKYLVEALIYVSKNSDNFLTLGRTDRCSASLTYDMVPVLSVKI